MPGAASVAPLLRRENPQVRGLHDSFRRGEERMPCVRLVFSYSAASAAPLDLQSAARPPSPPAPLNATIHEPQANRYLPHSAPESQPFHGPTPPSPQPCPLTGAPKDLNKYRANSNKQYISPQRNFRLLPRPAWLRLARADGRMSRPSRRPCLTVPFLYHFGRIIRISHAAASSASSAHLPTPTGPCPTHAAAALY
jgi:hypothetical protein